ncbi:hypothetical protein KPY62_01675 [Psychrobacter sp. TAE2020]|uniref:hypothetical protein n=1 Tax=Psychrobacter sp. TAE2020 TaxID=2846762 RepID=UPI001C111AB3|nr:hypothetical protein [Psychrobacter sp. TAE2020]MBU5615830.1 hypothetical protein [Psychrobacter sp. TAE2020]
MKKTLIEEVLIKSTCDDGQLFIESSLDQNKGSGLYTHLSKGHKVISSKRFIKLADGQEISIPISNIIELLPDRTGFIVIYKEQPSKFSQATSYPWFFKYPNNAAVYNADGSLRFQIKLTDNLKSSLYIESFAQESIEHPDKNSVTINSTSNPIYSFYTLFAVDPTNPQLIETSQKIRR